MLWAGKPEQFRDSVQPTAWNCNEGLEPCFGLYLQAVGPSKTPSGNTVYENTWLGNTSHFKVICEPRMSGLVSKPCYRNRKSILCHNGTKAILFKHAVFKQSTHGKADFVIGSWSLFQHWGGMAELLEREQSLARSGPCRNDCRSVSSASVPSWTDAYGGREMLRYVRRGGGSGTASGQRPETEQLVEQNGEKSCLLLPGSRGQVERHCRDSTRRVPSEPLPQETPWLWVVPEQKVRVLSTGKKKLCHFVSVAYVIPGNLCPKGAGISLRNKWDERGRRRNWIPALPLTKAGSPLARCWGQDPLMLVVYHQNRSGRPELAVPSITTPCWSKNRRELAADVPGQLATDAEAEAHRKQTLFSCVWEDKRPDSGPLV